LIPTFAVPVSLIGTFIALKAIGYSANTVSLLAIVLAIGIVVDDAIFSAPFGRDCASSDTSRGETWSWTIDRPTATPSVSRAWSPR
jgi:AcrB/AcrD/AcrF family